MIPRLGRFPCNRKGKPTSVFLPGKFHGQRSLVGYSPWGCRELDMTIDAYNSTTTKKNKQPNPKNEQKNRYFSKEDTQMAHKHMKRYKSKL